MVNEIRLRRLTELVKRRAQEAILMELKDPRLGFLTVTQVILARDLTHAKILWSIIGTKGDRSKAAHALDDARGYVQSLIAKAMQTKVTPRIEFEFDPSLEKAQKVFEILAHLRKERGEDAGDETPKGTSSGAGGDEPEDGGSEE